MNKSRFKIFSFFFICILSNGVTAQSQTANYDCNATILVDANYLGSIDIFQSPDLKKVVRNIKHDVKNEDFLVLDLKKDSNNMFKVSAFYSINGHIADGWIKKLDCLGIYARYWEDPNTVKLYSLPNKNSPIKNKIVQYTTRLFTVKGCNNDWLYVEIEIDKKKFEGWLAPDQQCANQYTTCN